MKTSDVSFAIKRFVVFQFNAGRDKNKEQRKIIGLTMLYNA